MKNALEVSPADVPMTTKKRPAEDTDNRGELNSINIEMTENGCIVRCSFDPKKLDPKRSRYDQMPEDEKYSFDDPDKALAYIGKMLKGHADDEAAEESGGKKKPAKKAKEPAAEEADSTDD
jgi:hypothetical protein